MTRDEINAFCAALPQSTHVIQWGNSDVWKVGGKLFAVVGWNGGNVAVTFKVTSLAFEILPETQGIRPATYSYEMAIGAMTKKKRAEMRL